MKIEVTELSGLPDNLGFDLILQTRTVETHSRLQQLNEKQLEEIRNLLRETLFQVESHVLGSTKPPTA